MFITKDISQFKSLFIEKLKGMLSDEGLGAFILVLANSQQDMVLQKMLEKDLRNNFSQLKGKYLSGELKATDDDKAVFEKLLTIDMFDLPVWQTKKSGCWEISYNSMRQLRPARASSQVFKTINMPFDDNKFHFNKPFLKPEILWEGEYENNNLRVLYNKFPFSDYHLLISLSPEKKHSQFLTRESHKVMVTMVTDAQKSLPGFGVGFNSIAAGASVNHLHFQVFLRQQMFPIEAASWSHNGGELIYPITVKCFDDVETSWRYIETLIEQDIAFNCLYRASMCYVIPRVYQSKVVLPDWLSGAGWLDVAGVMTVSHKNESEEMDEMAITEGLSLLKCTPSN